MKTAILLAAYGSTDPKAGQDLDLVASRAAKRFPRLEIRWAWTSSFVRARLARKGIPAPSPREALAGLAADGFGRVAIQPLHVVAGQDFEELAAALQEADLPLRPALGRPLLSSAADIERAAEAILAGLDPERSPEEAVVFMGHGTAHPAGAAYPALAQSLARLDPLVFLGCLESKPGIEEIRGMLLQKGLRRARLLPFTALAGVHAQRDLAGPGPDSWASVLNRSGIRTKAVLKGLCRNRGVVEIWLDHLAEALEEL